MSEWTAEYPSEEGWFWFYGYPSECAKRFKDCQLMPVQVRKASKGFMVCTEARFLFPRDCDGVWMPMTVPDLPNGGAP